MLNVVGVDVVRRMLGVIVNIWVRPMLGVVGDGWVRCMLVLSVKVEKDVGMLSVRPMLGVVCDGWLRWILGGVDDWWLRRILSCWWRFGATGVGMLSVVRRMSDVVGVDVVRRMLGVIVNI